MKISLKQGRESVTLELDQKKIIDILHGREIHPLTSDQMKDIIADGIANHSPEDISRKKIAIIIPDNTRLWARGDLYVPVIVQALQKIRVAPENITIVIALGTHADIEADKFPDLAGEYSCKTVKILNSANKNIKRLIRLGTTSRGTEIDITKEVVDSDHIIIFGGVLHHMIAGYGGGRKYIFPGSAGYDSIQQNHSLTLDKNGLPHPQVRQAQLEGNPVHEDIDEACELVLQNRGCTYISLAVNGEGNIFHTSVGPLKQTFLESCQKLNQVCTAEIINKGDFVICSAGGHRTDGQLYQSVKALFNGVEAVKKGGEILLFAECSEGYGNPKFGEMLKQYRSHPAKLGEKLLNNFDMPSYIALRVIDLLQNCKVSLVSQFERQETEELGFSYVQDVSDYVKRLSGKGYIIPYAENILPILK
ncbi:nickel-dependent lactate racemase [Desulfopila sp. IMCC35008]|uniref:nickel-dependent lactate racemase n=1 Tax=Desulfopila sp. IMCC35008 TaxID=2653858 RepID=UPI0013D02C4E|nr:nickel-dependent lactate racemase [Desulfopila sp. IMCC35008]